jgi:hypothetical protein
MHLLVQGTLWRQCQAADVCAVRAAQLLMGQHPLASEMLQAALLLEMMMLLSAVKVVVMAMLVMMTALQLIHLLLLVQPCHWAEVGAAAHPPQCGVCGARTTSHAQHAARVCSISPCPGWMCTAGAAHAPACVQQATTCTLPIVFK